MAEIEECRRSRELDALSDLEFELDPEKAGVRVDVIPVLGPGRGCKVIDATADDTISVSPLSKITRVLARWGVETNGYAEPTVCNVRAA